MSTYFMGIDIGTYESKGTLVDENAKIVAYHACPHEMEVPQPGYAEHDAENTWWGDFCTISRALIAGSGVDPADIRGVGCSTIAPCCLPVDEELRPLRKAILYGIDCRAAAEIAYLKNSCGASRTTSRRSTPELPSLSPAVPIWWPNSPENLSSTTTLPPLGCPSTVWSV